MSELAPSAQRQGQLSILLLEYQALRSEVNQRIGSAASMVGFVGAGAAFVVSSGGGETTWIAAAVIGALLLTVWASNLLALAALGGRLRRLETAINDCARVIYELDTHAELLGWENGLHRQGGWLRRLARSAGANV